MGKSSPPLANVGVLWKMKESITDYFFLLLGFLSLSVFVFDYLNSFGFDREFNVAQISFINAFTMHKLGFVIEHLLTYYVLNFLTGF